MSPVKSCPSMWQFLLSPLFGGGFWHPAGLGLAAPRQLPADSSTCSHCWQEAKTSSEGRVRQGRSCCGALSELPVSSSPPWPCFPPFHEGWLRLLWSRAQMKVPGTLSTSQKGTNKAGRVLWLGPGKNLSGLGGILGDYPAKYLVTKENLLFSFLPPFIISAAEYLI